MWKLYLVKFYWKLFCTSVCEADYLENVYKVNMQILQQFENRISPTQTWHIAHNTIRNLQKYTWACSGMVKTWLNVKLGICLTRSSAKSHLQIGNRKVDFTFRCWWHNYFSSHLPKGTGFEFDHEENGLYVASLKYFIHIIFLFIYTSFFCSFSWCHLFFRKKMWSKLVPQL